MPITLADLAGALLACLEGQRLKAYRDSGGVLTIGVGHTHGVTEGQVVTPAESSVLLAQDAAPLYSLVAGMPILAATAHLSFGFNCGRGALQKVLSGADAISNPIHTTDRHGNVLDGLVSRRHLEQVLIALSGWDFIG